MTDHESLHNVLSILLRYLKGEKFTMERLMSITGRTDKTIRNYHTTLKKYGFEIIYSSKRYMLKEGDETSVHRLIQRLGLYQDSYFSDDSQIKNIRSQISIKPGLQDFPYDELKVLYNLYINPNEDIDLNQIPTIEYKQLVDIINYLNTK
jgi:hypothetical protein